MPADPARIKKIKKPLPVYTLSIRSSAARMVIKPPVKTNLGNGWKTKDFSGCACTPTDPPGFCYM
jgi:hypothetical protein